MKQFLSEMNKVSEINLDYSINSGQVFLWEKVRNNWYGINGSDVIAISEDSKHIESLSKNPIDILRIGDDSKKIIQSISKDKIVKKAVKRFNGLRLLRQDPFQCYISFIISSNSNIQKIRTVLQNLCKKFGNKVIFDRREFFLFPDSKALSKANRNDLLSCGLGYRAKFVKEATNKVNSGEIDFDYLKKTNYNNAKESLLKIYGVGNKIADCIMLFSLDKLDAFPLDRWMIRVLKKYYFEKFPILCKTLTEKTYENLHKEIVHHFGPYAGYSQQFLFKMERDLNEKKWL
jgi:N-glycosylase/DNA lyase